VFVLLVGSGQVSGVTRFAELGAAFDLALPALWTERCPGQFLSREISLGCMHYPMKDKAEILTDLIKTTQGEGGKWYLEEDLKTDVLEWLLSTADVIAWSPPADPRFPKTPHGQHEVFKP